MTGKRFAWKTEKLQHSDDEVLLVVDNENKEWKGHILNIVDLLNELAEENNILNKNEDDLKECTIENIKLKEENEELEKGKMEALSLLGEEIDKNEQLKEQVQILNKCCKHKLSDEEIKKAYADLNRREREKHSQGNVTYTAKINPNEVIY